jgi:glyoxylate reductase
MPKIVITQKIPDIAEKMLSEAGYDVDILSHDSPPTPEELRAEVAGATALVTDVNDTVDDALMAAAGDSLKLIANFAVGFNNIDLEAAHKRGIIVTNTPGSLAEAVAEHSIALILAVSKQIVPADKFVRSGQFHYWQPMGFLAPHLWGRTIGIVGLGQIGSFLASICFYGFKMNVLYNDLQRNERFEMDVKAQYCELPELLEQADIVSLNVPLLPSTHHLISTDQLKKMKDTAILINTSRGPVIDEKALVEALQNKEIMGAGLDVFENEPDLEPGLVELDNVVLTPHIASATIEARDDMATLVAKNVISVLSGHPPISQVEFKPKQ